MKKNTKKILTLSVLGLFVFVFAMQFVSAANPIGDSFLSAFNDWQSGEVSEALAKFLLMALIAIFVYSVGDKIPGFNAMYKKNATGFMRFLGILMALIIAFLSIAYVTPDEVYSIMSSYSALGYTLAGGLPLIVLTFFTISMATKGGGATERVSRKTLAFILWLGYTLFGFYRFFFIPDGVAEANRFILILFPIAGLIMIWSTNTIFLKLAKEIANEKYEIYKKKKKDSRLVTEEESKDVDESSKDD